MLTYSCHTSLLEHGVWSMEYFPLLVDLHVAIPTHTSLRFVSGSPPCTPMLTYTFLPRVLWEGGPNFIFSGSVLRKDNSRPNALFVPLFMLMNSLCTAPRFLQLRTFGNSSRPIYSLQLVLFGGISNTGTKTQLFQPGNKFLQGSTPLDTQRPIHLAEYSTERPRICISNCGDPSFF
jgi:hypothetical protein